MFHCKQFSWILFHPLCVLETCSMPAQITSLHHAMIVWERLTARIRQEVGWPFEKSIRGSQLRPWLPAKFTLFNSKVKFFELGFHHEKIKIFKKSSNFKKSSLGDKLKSVILARNSKKQKSCIYLKSEPPFARGSSLRLAKTRKF